MNTQSLWKAGSIVVVSAGLLLVPASLAQKAAPDDGTAGSKASATESAAKPAKSAPAAQPAKPEPSPPPASSSAEDYPRVETAPQFMYIHTSKVFGGGQGFNCAGGGGTFAYNFTKWLGLAADLGGCKLFNLSNQYGVGSRVDGNLFTYLFGPRLTYRSESRFTPFAEVNFGGTRAKVNCNAGPCNGLSVSKNAFALTAGGGFDVKLNRTFAIRVVQAEYLYTHFGNDCVVTGCNQNNHQNSFRLKSGLVIGWGGGAPPVPPSAACSVQPSEVFAGEPVTATASGSNFNPKRTVKYNWSGTGVKVSGSEASTQVDTTGLQPGSYGVTANLSDGSKNGSASCSARFTVKEPRAPVISCSANPPSVQTGGTSSIRSTASSPDRRRLTYSYTASAGNISGTGDTATLNTRDARPGRITVNCNVSDDRNPPLTASATTAVNVEAPPPPPAPEIKKLEARLELHSIYFQTARPTVGNPGGGLVDSQAEILKTLAADFVAYLKYKPDAHLILSGHADPRGTEEYNMGLTQRRVDRTKNFLVEHGVPADHIETRAFGKEQELTADQVKEQMADNPDLSPAERQQMLKNLRVLVLANNRRVDVSLPTGQQSVRRYPFNAKDFLALSSPKSGEEKPPAKKQPKKQ